MDFGRTVELADGIDINSQTDLSDMGCPEKGLRYEWQWRKLKVVF